MSLAVSSTEDSAILARLGNPPPDKSDVFLDTLARTSLKLFQDSEVSDQMPDGQHMEVCTRAAWEAIGVQWPPRAEKRESRRYTGGIGAGFANVPEFIP